MTSKSNRAPQNRQLDDSVCGYTRWNPTQLLPCSWLPRSQSWLTKQAIIKCFCLPGTGIDPGYTAMRKAKSPSLKSLHNLEQNCFPNFRELTNCAGGSLKMPISGFYPRDVNSKSKTWSLEICLFNKYYSSGRDRNTNKYSNYKKMCWE